LPQTITAKQDRKQKHGPGNTISNSVADERGYQTMALRSAVRSGMPNICPMVFSSNARTGAGHAVSTGSFDAAWVAASILSTLEPD